MPAAITTSSLPDVHRTCTLQMPPVQAQPPLSWKPPSHIRNPFANGVAWRHQRGLRGLFFWWLLVWCCSWWMQKRGNARAHQQDYRCFDSRVRVNGLDNWRSGFRTGTDLGSEVLTFKTEYCINNAVTWKCIIIIYAFCTVPVHCTSVKYTVRYIYF